MHDETPSRIGPYRILGKLGQGGMATVFKAVQEALGRQVAIKLVAPHLAGDPQFKSRFLKEAQVMAGISHPNVVACFDAGQADGHLYMAMELVTGGDLLKLIDRRGGRLEEKLALELLRDCFSGLEALEGAGLVHRDLKPANIFLTDKGQAKLADLGLARSMQGDRTTMAGMIMGTPAYIAPEQARGQDDLDIRADIFSLGATLFHLVTGSTAYSGDNPMTTLVRVLNDPLPDPRSRRGDLSDGMRALILRLMDKERGCRPASARQARELVERLLTGQAAPTPIPPSLPPPPAAKPSPGTTAKPEAEEVDPGVQASTPPSGGGSPAIDIKQLALLAKRIVVDKDAMRASLVLAQGASFPLILLSQLLEVSGIRYGRIEHAIMDATRPSSLPRRITLARGDPPTPDRPGRTVHGEVVPRLEASFLVKISEDAMSAFVLFRPGEAIPRAELDAAVREARIAFGVDPAALDRLAAGKGPASGKLVVAKGRAAIPPFPGGFKLHNPVAIGAAPGAESSTAEAVANLQQVQPGAILALWSDPSPGEPGVDVRGRTIRIEAPEEKTPDDLAGEGTEIGRNHDGDLVLRSTRAGVAQLQLDGRVRVVGVLEIKGDLGPDQPPIKTDDLVVVRGSVQAGAKIESSSDVVVLGDLKDAAVSAGGHLQVEGKIHQGDAAIEVAGVVAAAEGEVRRITAATIKIAGEAHHCELIATGSISIGRVVGGSVSAGGDVHIDTAGDADGTPTTLWAGHHLSFNEQAALIRTEERRLEAERAQLVNLQKELAADVDDAALRAQRLALGRFVRPEALKAAAERIKLLHSQREKLERESEEARNKVARSKKQREEMSNLGDNAKARLRVRTVAYDGVTAKVANAEPLILAEPRLQFKLDVG